MSDRQRALRSIRAVLAADCACPEQAFLDDGVVVTEADARAGRRRFSLPRKPLLVVTMGAGVVVSCHPERLPWARATLGGLGRDAVFSAGIIARLERRLARDRQDLAGPQLKYACSRDRRRPIAAPTGVAIAVVEGAAIAELYQHAGFPNALSYAVDAPRPDVLASVASQDGQIVGVAGVSADSAVLWQIGVEVRPAARGQGVGRALVGRLSDVVLELGKIPYYSTVVSNIPSRALAIGVGYWPAWTELYARDRSERRDSPAENIV